MNYWIFKYTEQKLYPDVHGKEYAYDNTHSVKVRPGDVFIYLHKIKSAVYAFTGTGMIQKVRSRIPTQREAARTAKVKTVFVAEISDYLEFKEPLSILPSKKIGLANRAKLAIEDVNLLGWSQSVPRISEAWYEAIMDLAQEAKLIPEKNSSDNDYSVPDKWAKTRIRQAGAKFSQDVLERHCRICVVCGTGLSEVLEAAHLSPYAADEKNRGNPANGICLCRYCHKALDRRIIAIAPNGDLFVAPNVSDPIAVAHFTAIKSNVRCQWLKGIDSSFLELTVKWFKESNSNAQAKFVVNQG